MGKYSEEFFREYEEIYSDSKQRDAALDEREDRTDRYDIEDRDPHNDASDRYGRQQTRRYPDQNRRQQPVRGANTAQYDRYNKVWDRNAEYGRQPYRSDDTQGAFDSERYGFEDRPAQRDPRQGRRPTSGGKPKKRLTRRTRRALIVTVFVIVVLLLLTSIIALAKSISGGKTDPKDVKEAVALVEETAAPDETEPDSAAANIDPNKPMVALTFDDGPAVGGSSGDRILDTLEQYNAKGTFFMLGCNAGEAPDNLKRKVDLGMEIGNHTWNHTHYGEEVSPDDISQASSGIEEVCGHRPTCFRSPGGMTTQTILTECAAENMAAYYWTIDTEDWRSRDADKVYHAVMDYVKDGDIILMHEIYDSTADAVEKLVPALQEQGYQLVTCHDLVKYKSGADPTPGKEYNSGSTEMVR